MQKILSFLFLLTLSFFSNAQSPFQNVLIGSWGFPNEPAICISPVDTNIITAAANTDLFYSSTDGGKTWSMLQADSKFGVFGDPCLVADTNGAFLYFHLAQNDTITIWPRWADRIVCQKTVDGGNTWLVDTFAGLNLPKMQDKEWSVVDPARNYVYTAWTQFDLYGSTAAQDSSVIRFSASQDGGTSWSAAKTIGALEGDCVDSDSTIEGAMPAVGPNGEVYLAYAVDEKIYFNKSTDFGNTWLGSEIHVADQLEGWDYEIAGIYRCNGMPVLHCDLSGGPHTGTIYLNWTDKQIANDADVYFAKSIDGGDTWSAPVRVNDDPAGSDNFMSWMTVDQTNGDIYIVYYDRRNHPSTTLTDVYMARSTDGGSSFSNFRISNTPFTAQAGIFHGDYINLSAVNGCVRPVWTRQDTGQTSIWTALINFKDSSTVVNGIDKQSSVDGNWRLMSENPTKGSCVIAVGDIGANGTVSLFTADGRLVYEWTKVDAKGFLKFNLADLGLPSSLYYLRCSDGLSGAAFRLVYCR